MGSAEAPPGGTGRGRDLKKGRKSLKKVERTRKKETDRERNRSGKETDQEGNRSEKKQIRKETDQERRWSEMEIRHAVQSELEQILELYRLARQFMRENGNPDQWGEHYPQRELVQQDLADNCLYVCEEDGELLGVFYFSMEEDPDYREICQGSWIGNGPYGVMHRVACPGKRKGAATFCLTWCFRQSGGDLRIDTHEDNRPMQNLLLKNGFTRCGIVHPKDGGERIGFEKVR